MTIRRLDPLQDALAIQARIKGLRALLELQRWQIEVLSSRLYAGDSAGTAARRLLALKLGEGRSVDPQRRRR